MKIEIHILQNFAPSNLNRDDAGLPKDCEFGGVRRGRISSQCLKRNIRYSNSFSGRLGELTGVRTRKAAGFLMDVFMKKHDYSEAEAFVLAEVVFDALKLTIKDEETKYLYYTDKYELQQLAKLMNDMKDDYFENLKIAASEDSNKTQIKNAKAAIKTVADKMIKEFLKLYSHKIDSVDIALFGRMLADRPEMKIDAACQVAHAISTNRVSMDFDYFTAVDDLNPEEETGAGMIGNIGYNSSCYYRYSLIDFDMLAKNLTNKQDIAKEGVLGFIEGAVEAIPTGKQNSFGAQNPPAFVLVNIKNGAIPTSLANAFERPANPYGNKTLTDVSMLELNKYWQNINDTYGIENEFVKFFKINKKLELSNLKEYEVKGIKELVKELDNYISSKIQAEA